ncbi:MAG: RecB family exonuclease [Actinomycetota bacterium]
MAVFSHTRLEAFRNCPLSYKYQYIDRIKSERDSIEAFMGSRAHETLEKLYRDLMLSRLNTEEELVDFYNRTWRRNWHDNVFIVRSDYTAENYRETGERGIRDYYRRYAPFDQGRTVWIEQRIKVDLDEAGRYSIIAFVDRLVDLGNGVYEVHDYKTSSSLPEQDKLDTDRQLALYQLAVHDCFPDVREVQLLSRSGSAGDCHRARLFPRRPRGAAGMALSGLR